MELRLEIPVPFITMAELPMNRGLSDIEHCKAILVVHDGPYSDRFRNQPQVHLVLWTPFLKTPQELGVSPKLVVQFAYLYIAICKLARNIPRNPRVGPENISYLGDQPQTLRSQNQPQTLESGYKPQAHTMNNGGLVLRSKHVSKFENQLWAYLTIGESAPNTSRISEVGATIYRIT